METGTSLRKAALTLCALVGFGCAAHHDSLSMNLAWSPSSDPGDTASSTADAFLGQKVQLMPLTDDRSVKDVGSNVQEAAPRPVRTIDDVPSFVTSHVSDVLLANHINMVQAGPTRVLQGAINDFFVKEDNTYNGTVILTFTLTNGQGKQLWQGVATGHSKRFGRSLSAENYNETLSEATIEAVHDLLKTPAFLTAVHAG